MLNRKKAICDFSNEARVTALHINNDYNGSWKKNSDIFKKYTNICTNVYDVAHMFGIEKPFKVWLKLIFNYFIYIYNWTI